MVTDAHSSSATVGSFIVPTVAAWSSWPEHLRKLQGSVGGDRLPVGNRANIRCFSAAVAVVYNPTLFDALVGTSAADSHLETSSVDHAIRGTRGKVFVNLSDGRLCVLHVSIVDDYTQNCKRKAKVAQRFLKKRRM